MPPYRTIPSNEEPLLVHLYKKIDPDIVHSSIANILRDYPRYQRSIVQYLDSLEAENG
ncbi:hypothetical protein [Microcystis flos-aquae]|uniref:hypothetical protein n=1 Tax=Microcystis flos-aquae TaxID=109615 RepID=UPI001F558944|nr:hypothetical protein [Microcystis flos-aquae]